MWVNPNHRDRIEVPKPPPLPGRVVASFRRGPGRELRVIHLEEEGPWAMRGIAIRESNRDAETGEWWPGRVITIPRRDALEILNILERFAGGQGLPTLTLTGGPDPEVPAAPGPHGAFLAPPAGTGTNGNGGDHGRR